MAAFFILGNHPELAQEELASVLGVATRVFDVRAHDVAIVEGIGDFTLAALQERLGGVIKSGNIIAEAKDQDEVLDVCKAYALTEMPSKERRSFGVSVYDAGHRGRLVVWRASLEKFGMRLKRSLQDHGSVRYVTASRIPVLSSVVVKKQGLIGDGVEFCLFPLADGVMIGVTETVQDFEKWGERDYGRPSRDAVRGMLPPKLARMMVNLAQGDPSKHTLLDPYCGVGTVLTEAAVVGYRSIIGGDKDVAAVEATRENMAFLVSKHGAEVHTQLIHTKAESLATFLAPRSVDRLVSEVHLGVPRDGSESRVELEMRMDKLAKMYTEGFRAFSHILAPDAVLVMAFPAYPVEGTVVTAPILERAKLFGLCVTGGPWRYGRESQLVFRDIYRFSHSA
ncbi:hypothetical protein A3B32_00440 [Candidatus Uhrbacteria bacterium RIFCSPLOWO2_01_FULL_53_9]|uniref:Ribosomal RNA large subunit methyltransferase K/L-like methyltransferase domain-containing protein n=3 Tax=Candidatus Uhriibacteriota TaxID=1752732 RepID=A0A1F7UYE8_9BACT|nr:MAG: hypothetical protein A3C17_00070 [Candidatus Uhrbacteria bacterium RIFCSPHIGHO2_02_FULL_53_13]OGL83246.1 MAG: hypothetical protein A3B32_00440 [Candidatus Uhrbacteria bacterium RIFCSPLOWO2_01_FULL_53_9]OGL89443.1 MAG: hypothetical protein A3I45_01885 [Candidatus Uhrbacteria bacterium RIFCSPLOWO2_02_FULL_53_10]